MGAEVVVKGIPMRANGTTTSKHLMVAIITALIFVLGIFVGNMLTEQKLGELKQLQQELRSDTLSFSLQRTLVKDSVCKKDVLKPTYKKLYDLGAKLSAMEEQLGRNHPEVSRLKRYYTLLQVQQWLTLKEVNAQCQKTDDWILYFYSNDKDQCPRCDQQGFVLTPLRESRDNLKVFSIDADLDERVVQILKEAYGVTKMPTLVINGESIHGFQNLDALQQQLNRSMNDDA